ncbi:AfsR/SARP family transcriptional regulator [Streptomyces fragilis]|uniref:BTAD domain-containing putative transcriptional regulator n=1 Tax=Streptomyces fragilis TaxID=67301 RepID=A0ABV2YAP5_9ACTN
MRFRVLGTIQVTRPDGTPVPVGGAKLRTLLSLLALRPGRAVPVSVLVDEVWSGDPPADATGALQALVGRLRRLLGPGAVASADGGYLLDAGPDDVDLYRFERLTADGLRALADGDPAEAATTLDEALALWRGPALADLPHPGAEAARWEARRLDARRARLTAALALGEAAAVLPDLTALCEAHPLDEPLQALRLRALAAAGRPAEALAAYEALRRHLADTLGADPGPALRATHAALLRGETSPNFASPPTAPSSSPGAHSTGHARTARAAGAEAAGDAWSAGAEAAEDAHAAGRAGSAHAAGAPTGAPSAWPPAGPPYPAADLDPATAPPPGGPSPSPVTPPADPGRAVVPPLTRPDATAVPPPAPPGAATPPAHPDGSAGTPPTGDRTVVPPLTDPASPTVPPFTHPDGAAPGPDGVAPGPGGVAPGRDGVAPGYDGAAPGPGGPAPGYDGAAPGPGGAAPGPSGAAPGPSGAAPGPGGPAPGYDGAAPRPGGAAPGRDGSAPGPYGAASHPDGAAPGYDGATSHPDGATPGYDGATSHPDGATPGYDGATSHPDGVAPGRSGASPARDWTATGPARTATGPGGTLSTGGPATAEAGPGAGGAAPARAAVAGNLRAPLTSFVGRDADVAALHRDLAGARLVTLLGPGGAGKTRLSQEAARTTAAGVAPDGVWLAELAPVDDPAAVPEAVLTAVGARETVLYGGGAEEMRAATDRTDDPVRRLAEHCARRRLLLVLDNCEHVIEAAARLAEELLARCPHLTVLATSREPLGVPGELIRPVEPLPEPHAMRLLADRGAAARPGFRVDADAETAAACAEICRRLDGLPLAIELAAARLRMLTPRQLADRLDDRFRLLTSGSRTALPRQQTLRAVVDWSWDLLDDAERTVLRRMSVFAGGCDLDAAEAVCGPRALEALASLVDKSLVVAAPAGDGAMRYRLLETVAEYARERLAEAGEHAATAHLHLTHYRELARANDPLLRSDRQLDAIGRLETEYENLRTALRTAVTERDEQEALYLVLSLTWFWQIRGLRSEARHWSTAVMDLGPDPFAPGAPAAVPLWERCTDTPPPIAGDRLWEARRGVHLVHLACMDMKGELKAWQDPAAQEKLRAIARTYEPGMPQVCRNPGTLWFFAVLLTGQVERLREIVDAAVRTTADRPDHAWEHALALQMRANLIANRPDWDGDAVADAARSLEICRRLGDVWSIAEALCARGAANERAGRFEQAADDYRQAVGQVELLGAHAQRDVLRSRLGAVLLETERPERGERLLREVIASGPLGDQESGPAARIVLASWLGVTGRVPEARRYVREIREEFPAAAFIVFDSFIAGTEALLDAMDGSSAEALGHVRRALSGAGDSLSRTIAPHLHSFLLTVAAVALAGHGGERASDGARCLGAAVAALGEEHVSGVAERRLGEHAESVLRAALGDAAYEAAHAEGRGLPVEEAAALV